MTPKAHAVYTHHSFRGMLWVNGCFRMATAAIGYLGVPLRMACRAVACRAPVRLRKRVLPDIDLFPALLAVARRAIRVAPALVRRRRCVAVAARIAQSDEGLRPVALDTFDIGVLTDQLDRVIKSVLRPCRLGRMALCALHRDAVRAHVTGGAIVGTANLVLAVAFLAVLSRHHPLRL